MLKDCLARKKEDGSNQQSLVEGYLRKTYSDLEKKRNLEDNKTTRVPCTKRILDRINVNLRWASMKFKPSKSQSISICRGKKSDRKFVFDEEIPTVWEKPVKSSGRWYSVDLNDKKQV